MLLHELLFVSALLIPEFLLLSIVLPNQSYVKHNLLVSTDRLMLLLTELLHIEHLDLSSIFRLFDDNGGGDGIDDDAVDEAVNE